MFTGFTEVFTTQRYTNTYINITINGQTRHHLPAMLCTHWMEFYKCFHIMHMCLYCHFINGYFCPFLFSSTFGLCVFMTGTFLYLGYFKVLLMVLPSTQIITYILATTMDMCLISGTKYSEHTGSMSISLVYMVV